MPTNCLSKVQQKSSTNTKYFPRYVTLEGHENSYYSIIFSLSPPRGNAIPLRSFSSFMSFLGPDDPFCAQALPLCMSKKNPHFPQILGQTAKALVDSVEAFYPLELADSKLSSR